MNLSSRGMEIVAVQAVAWLAGHDDLLPVFLGATGADGNAMRDSLEDPVFQGSVLDFILLDDAWIREFCDSVDLPYDLPFKARQSLAGGSDMNWT